MISSRLIKKVLFSPNESLWSRSLVSSQSLFRAAKALSTFLCLTGVFLSTLVVAEPLKVVVPPWGGLANFHDDYFYRLLVLVLANTEAQYGPAEIVPYSEALTATRFVADLKQNKTVDLIWHGTSRQYERELLAIPISITKELNEYRVLLIRKEDQPRFSAVKTLADLRQYVSGGGVDWPSQTAMLKNGLPVIDVTNPNLLFNMLKAKRFDFISRNLFEVWGEGERYAKDGLTIEQTLLVHGGEPFYFFVSKSNPALGKRIEDGLKIAIADGSFDTLVASDDGLRRGQELLNKNRRRLLQLYKNYSPNSRSLPSNH
jgi:hypothetical protein